MKFELSQSDFCVILDFEASTVGAILALSGGQAASLIGIFTIMLGGYQTFSHGKSQIKVFYSEDSLETFENDEMSACSYDDELRRRMR